MIGLSVSYCIRDIVEGKVKLEEVEKIVAGTCAITKEQVENVVKTYRLRHWHKNPDEGEKIYRQLLAEGKIIQPRASSGPAPVRTNTHWVEREDQIEWWSNDE
jgi:hypothetical protein